MGIANRRQVAQDRDRWRRATRETLVLFWIAQPQKNTTTAAAATTTTTSSSSSSCGPCSSFDVVLYITCTVCNIYSISNLEKIRTHTHTHTHTYIYIYVKKHGKSYTACLVCSKVVSAPKEYSLRLNYETLHTHTYCVLEVQLREDILKITKCYLQQQNILTVVSKTNEAAVKHLRMVSM
jgi:hypothetical protein